MHNFLFMLERNQKNVIKILMSAFLVLSIVWWLVEFFKYGFPLKPIVVMVGGFATLFSVYWPWRAVNESQRVRNRIRFNYMTNNGSFTIGRGKTKFELSFSKSSDENIYLYSDPSSIDVVALATGAGQIKDIRDVSSFNFSNRSIVINEGDLAVLRNVNNLYAVVHVHDVQDSGRNDAVDEVVFSYVINTEGTLNFS